MQHKLNFRELEKERILRVRAYLSDLMQAWGGLCQCFDHHGNGQNHTHIATEETFDLLERGLELLNQAVATLRKKPDLRILQ